MWLTRTALPFGVPKRQGWNPRLRRSLREDWEGTGALRVVTWKVVKLTSDLVMSKNSQAWLLCRPTRNVVKLVRAWKVFKLTSDL